MKPGDLVKFSKSHYEDSPGLGYVENWIGIVVESTANGLNDPVDELKILWSIEGKSHIMQYDELWWSKLDYEPFEVIDENR